MLYLGELNILYMQYIQFDQYKVYSTGIVLNAQNKKKSILYNSMGYPYYSLYINKQRKVYFVHRLVATLFIPNPNNYKVVNHINGIKDDFTLSNLEWCSHKENTRHAIELKLMTFKSGEKCKLSKLTNNDVQCILNLLESGMSNKSVAELYKIKPNHVANLKAGRSFTFITRPVFISKKDRVNEIKNALLADLKSGYSYLALEGKYGIGRKTIKKYLHNDIV